MFSFSSSLPPLSLSVNAHSSLSSGRHHFSLSKESIEICQKILFEKLPKDLEELKIAKSKKDAELSQRNAFVQRKVSLLRGALDIDASLQEKRKQLSELVDKVRNHGLQVGIIDPITFYSQMSAFQQQHQTLDAEIKGIEKAKQESHSQLVQEQLASDEWSQKAFESRIVVIQNDTVAQDLSKEISDIDARISAFQIDLASWRNPVPPSNSGSSSLSINSSMDEDDFSSMPPLEPMPSRYSASASPAASSASPSSAATTPLTPSRKRRGVHFSSDVASQEAEKKHKDQGERVKRVRNNALEAPISEGKRILELLNKGIDTPPSLPDNRECFSRYHLHRNVRDNHTSPAKIAEILKRYALEDEKAAQKNDAYRRGVDLQIEGWTALQLAMKRGDPNLITAILQDNPDTTLLIEGNWNALHVGSFYNTLNKATTESVQKILGTLLQHLDINAVNSKGATAAHLAAFHGNEKVLKFLVDRGANLSILDNSGFSALHYATLCKEKTKRVQLANIILANYWNDINTVDPTIKTRVEGFTPLIFAAEAGDVDLVKLLRRHTFCIDIPDVKGFNALHYTSHPFIGNAEQTPQRDEIIKMLTPQSNLSNS